MPPQFGTSGLRGLASELTQTRIAAYTRAFLQSCAQGPALYLGRDLRSSSEEISAHVSAAARAEGMAVIDCGLVATPALALSAMGAGCGAIMVTGSHIPADRNGLKFYRPDGEITKADEAMINQNLSKGSRKATASYQRSFTSHEQWITRYQDAFGAHALTGMKIAVWSHSAVSRDALRKLLHALGAEVSEIGRRDHFYALDTESLRPEDRDWLRAQAKAQSYDAIVSTDGDGDRPLLTTAQGEVVVGDLLGQITAAYLGAEVVVTPLNSNSGVERGGRFKQVRRCAIGSPFVIAQMHAVLQENPRAKVVGYEANGGFLLGFDAQAPLGAISALWTRDSLLPLLCCLYEARKNNGITQRLQQEPARFTVQNKLEHIDPTQARALLHHLEYPQALSLFLAPLHGVAQSIETTDGLRVVLADQRIIHLRPSGNAPEFRLYCEAASTEAANALLQSAQTQVAQAFAHLSPERKGPHSE